MDIKVYRYGLMETLVYTMFFLLPFTLVINTMIFKSARVAGIGILNLFYDLILVLAIIDCIISKKKYKNVHSVLFFYICFAVVHIFKIIWADGSLENFVRWLPNRQYYYLLPLVYLMLSNTKINYRKVARILIYSSIMICPVSLYMFLTTNYFGLATEYNLVQYAIVGTPFVRMFSVFGSPLVAGPYFALILMIIVYEMDIKKCYVKALLALNGVCMIFTFSRTSFISFFVVLFYKYISGKDRSTAKKILKITGGVLLAAVIISLSSSYGAYFWNKRDIIHNIRLEKWYAGWQLIRKNWLLGYNFETRISLFDTWESTLSDNSFLLVLSDFGMIFSFTIFLFILVRTVKTPKTYFLWEAPAIIAGIIFLLLCDFLQVFPGNYILIFFFIYLKQNVFYIRKKGMQKMYIA